MKDSKLFIYGNGKDKPPTGFMFEKEQMKGLYFNQSPTKVLSNVSKTISPQGFFCFSFIKMVFILVLGTIRKLFEITVIRPCQGHEHHSLHS